MIWQDHSRLAGQHAFLSASKYHWINYDADKLAESYQNFQAIKRGTELHEFAANAIRLNQKLKGNNTTLAMYVNDAIGYHMRPEQVLYYSDNCFGTADAIIFRDKLLRIHDLKTGQTPAHMEQLMIYAALFCLEYTKKPEDLKMELRIYQNNDIIGYIPEPSEISEIMATIISFDKVINEIREREES